MILWYGQIHNVHKTQDWFTSFVLIIITHYTGEWRVPECMSCLHMSDLYISSWERFRCGSFVWSLWGLCPNTSLQSDALWQPTEMTPTVKHCKLLLHYRRFAFLFHSHCLKSQFFIWFSLIWVIEHFEWCGVQRGAGEEHHHSWEQTSCCEIIGLSVTLSFTTVQDHMSDRAGYRVQPLGVIKALTLSLTRLHSSTHWKHSSLDQVHWAAFHAVPCWSRRGYYRGANQRERH